MPHMICQRNYTLRTTLGHTIAFEAGKPTFVPPVCVDAALAVNIIPATGPGFVDKTDEPVTGFARTVQMSPELREAILLHSIHELVRDAETADFDGGGKPKIASIKDRSGLELNSNDRAVLWDKYRDIIGSNSDLPNPKNLELVLEVQKCTTQKQVAEYLELLGMPKMKGESLKTMKAAAVQAAIAYDSTTDLAEGEMKMDEE